MSGVSRTVSASAGRHQKRFRERDIGRSRWRQAAFVQSNTIDPRRSRRGSNIGYFGDFRARYAISHARQSEMRFEGTACVALDDSGFAADDETALKVAQLLETGVNPKPQDSW